jgi:dephospho-CoA kinase
VATIDADQVARQVVAWGHPAAEDICRRFGADLYGADRTLDRVRLAKRIFDDAGERAALEAIVHPWVRKAIDTWFEELSAQGLSVGVAAIPLLFETGRQGEFDRVAVTACEPVSQLDRLMGRDGITRDAARKRLAAQLPTREKTRRADFVISTDGSFEETDRKVDMFCAMLLEEEGQELPSAT